MKNKKVGILGKEIIWSSDYEKLGFVDWSENLITFLMYEISTICKKSGKISWNAPENRWNISG